MADSNTSGEGLQCLHCGNKFASQQAVDMHVSAKHLQHSLKPAGNSFFKKHAWKFIAIGVVFLLGAGLWHVYNAAVNSPRIGAVGSAHIHSDIKVFVDGLPVNFALPKYQLRAQHVHFESGEGDYVHLHATGVTVGSMFESLGMKLSSQCLKFDDGRNLCNGNGKSLKFFVNNASNAEFEKYVFRDLDKILVSYGAQSEQEVQVQVDSVTSKSRNENGALVSNPLAVHAGS